VRVLGVDLGERRIGIAVSDSDGRLASPRSTILRGGDAEVDRSKIAAVVAETGAEKVVVGLPISLDGRLGRAARAAQTEAAALSAMLEPDGVGVETFDERLTTVSAERQLAEAGHKGRGRRRVVDQAAAAVMLQGWLDANRNRASGEDTRSLGDTRSLEQARSLEEIGPSDLPGRVTGDPSARHDV